MKPDFILLDDDEITLLIQKRLIMRSELARAIHTFQNCEDFFSFVQTAQFSPAGAVFMLDINMPQISGWDCITVIESANLQIPFEIFIVTSSVDPADLEKAAAYQSVNAVICKPVEIDALFNQSSLLHQEKV